MQKPIRVSCYYPCRGEIKHGDVKIIYFDHVSKTKKLDEFKNEKPE